MAEASSNSPGLRILFVCLGNICRSTMAEGVFRHVTRFGQSDADPRFANIDSCGTGAYHEGQEPDDRTMAVLQQHGISYDHAARKITEADFEEFDYIFAMDKDNLRYLERERGRSARQGLIDEDAGCKVQLWGTYGGKSNEQVADPYYGGRNGFEVAYKQMIRFTDGFLKHLDDKKS